MFKDKSLQYKINFVALALNAVAILLMFTSQYLVIFSNPMYSETISYGIFSFGGDKIVRMIESNSSFVPEQFWGNFYGIRAMYALFISISIIYFIHHLFSYTFIHKKTMGNELIINHQYVDFNMFYYEYSSIPLLLYVLFSWIVFVSLTMSYNSMSYISLFPTPMLLILTILLIVQFIINKIYTT